MGAAGMGAVQAFKWGVRPAGGGAPAAALGFGGGGGFGGGAYGRGGRGGPGPQSAGMLERLIEQKELQIRKLDEELAALTAREAELVRLVGAGGGLSGAGADSMQDGLQAFKKQRSCAECMLRDQGIQLEQVDQELKAKNAENSKVQERIRGEAGRIEAVAAEHRATRRAFLREFAELTDAYERQLEGRDLAAGVARLRAGLAALTAALLHLERAATAREAAA